MNCYFLVPYGVHFHMRFYKTKRTRGERGTSKEGDVNKQRRKEVEREREVDIPIVRSVNCSIICCSLRSALTKYDICGTRRLIKSYTP